MVPTREDRLRSPGAAEPLLSGRADLEVGEEHRLPRTGRPAADVPGAAERGIEPAGGLFAVRRRRPDRPVAAIVPDGGRSHRDAARGVKPAQPESFGAAAEGSLYGRLYGPGHEEVGGLFHRDGIAGAFAGKRDR